MRPIAFQTLQAITALTASANSTAVDLSDFTGNGYLAHSYGALTGTGATLDCKVQHSDDNVTFTDSGVAFAQVATGNAANTQRQFLSIDQFKRYVRLAYTLAGTSPAVSVHGTVVGDKATKS